MSKVSSSNDCEIGQISLIASSKIGRGRKLLRRPDPCTRSASTGSHLAKGTEGDRNTLPNDRDMIRGGSLPRSSNNYENILVDVLPSFEMYNSLHRHIPQGNINPDCHDFPPCYQEVEAQDDSILRNSDQPTEIQAFELRQPHIKGNSSSGGDTLQAFSTEHLSIPSSLPGNSHDPIEDDLNDSDNINIDKLYTLPRLVTPIEIIIRLTKNALKPHQIPDDESLLKEYTSGDVIHGYCIIENKSPQPIQFEMFYVTLEGYTSLLDRKLGKRTLKRFLRMVDLSASWSYANIQLSTGIDVVFGEVDYDNCILGLANNRILEPRVKYKKFFTFKLPNQLLDVTCKQGQFSHTLLPPSFGIDRFRNHGRYSGIKVNSILGCGHLGIKGSPILTMDMADENLSINYAVDARIVGKDKKSQNLTMMKEVDYNIRIIPFAFCYPFIGEPNTDQQLAMLTGDVEKRITALTKVLSRLENNESIQSTDFTGTDLEGSICDTLLWGESESTRNEMCQLQKMAVVSSSSSNPYEKKNSGAKSATDKIKKVEVQFSYKIKSGINGGLRNSFLSGLFGISSAKDALAKEKIDKAGLILIETKIPEQSLPYRPPSLLRKTNKFDKKNSYDQANCLRLLELVPEEMRTPLDHLDINLTCIQSNNSTPGGPPEIQSVSTEFLCITAKTDNSIPVKLTPLILKDMAKLHEIKKKFRNMTEIVSNLNEKFDENVTKLNKLFNMNNLSSTYREIRFDEFISSQLHNNLQSLANLDVNIVHLNDVFKKQSHTLKDSSIVQDTLSTVPSGGSLSNSSTFLRSTFSGSSEHSRSSTTSRFIDQIVHEWVQRGPQIYERTIRVNLEYNENIKETLIPTFESCLCLRFYCIRVNIKFDHHAGTATIDIPVEIKSFHSI